MRLEKVSNAAEASGSLQNMGRIFVSVIMPIRNEEMFIERSLRAVLSQDYPHELLEVLIADGQSEDGTREVIARLARAHPDVRLILIENPGRIVSTGFNIAFSQAIGKVIVLVGGHCEIAQDYISRCIEHLQCDGADAVGGWIETIGATRMSRVIALAMSSSFGVGGSKFRTVASQSMWVDTVPFAAYTRQAIDLAGPFDEELIRDQDDEYNYRLGKLGGKLLLAADVRSRYYSRASLPSLFRQYFQYGYWKVRVAQNHPWQMRPRHFVPPVFAFTLLLTSGMAPFASVARWGLALALGSYTVVNAMASVVAAREAGLRTVPLLMLTFATLHLSYGYGFLMGLGKFWNRWGESRQSNAFPRPTQ